MRVVAIVPAYNEEKAIGEVLKTITSSGIFTEIIVVNDGSQDNTTEIVRKYPVKLIVKNENEGKGSALDAGIKSSESDIYVLLDADLIGLRSIHIRELINPILREGVIMTVGKFKGGRIGTDLAQQIVPAISGQRAFRKAFLKDLPAIKDSGFGVELIFAKHAKNMNFKTKEVNLEKLSQVVKEEKLGYSKGFLYRLKMYWHMIKNIFGNKK